MSRGRDGLRRSGVAAAIWMAVAFALGAGGDDRTPAAAPPAGPSNVEAATRFVQQRSSVIAARARDWYARTPAADRVTWSGLFASALLGASVLVERLVRVRRSRVLPKRFADRWLDRLEDGPLDRSKALDLCELTPSPASRVALAALRRWGRPVADLERAVSLARQVEGERLTRNLGTLRRVAALSPLIGLLGTLFAAGRALDGLGAAGSAAWGPALAQSLAPLTTGVGLAILALLAFDGLTGRAESLIADLDRLGAETIDAIALATPAVTPRPTPHAPTPAPAPAPTLQTGPAGSRRGPHFRPSGAPSRGHRPIRAEAVDDLEEF